MIYCHNHLTHTSEYEKLPPAKQRRPPSFAFFLISKSRGLFSLFYNSLFKFTIRRIILCSFYPYIGTGLFFVESHYLGKTLFEVLITKLTNQLHLSIFSNDSNSRKAHAVKRIVLYHGIMGHIAKSQPFPRLQ